VWIFTSSKGETLTFLSLDLIIQMCNLILAIIYFSILLRWGITRSLISVFNATQTVQSLLYFKMSLKSHSAQHVSASQGQHQPTVRQLHLRTASLRMPMHFMLLHMAVRAKMSLSGNEHTLFAPRFFILWRPCCVPFACRSQYSAVYPLYSVAWRWPCKAEICYN
jgi:hypothetical protein